MQDLENNQQTEQENDTQKRRAKHATAEPESNAETPDAAASDEEEIFGNEGEIPLRLKKKKSGAKKKSKRSAKKQKNIKETFEPLFSEKKFRRKRSIFETMNASESDGVIKPIKIFGKEVRFWPFFLIALIVIFAAVVFMSNNNVQTENLNVTVVGLPEELEGYRIIVLSDLNAKRFGDEQSSLVRSVENLGYDMILCVGDMVGKSGDAEPFYEFLEGLSKPGRVYFIAGDADPGPYRSTPRATEGTLEEIVLEDWILGAIERGANYVDAPIQVSVGNSDIWLTPSSFLNLDASLNRSGWKAQMEQEQDGYLAGVEADYNSLPFTSYRYKLAQEFYEAQEEIGPSDFVIALSHQVPQDEFIKAAATHDDDDGRFLTEPELLVAGHYCGGVWKIPFAGAFYIPNRLLARYGWFPNAEDVDGLSKVGETQVYISPGLSTTSAVALPFRLNNDPTVTQLKLTAKLPDNMLESIK